MGIQDRDYMRDRHRRSMDDLMKDADRPFVPPKERSLRPWLTVAASLYVGFHFLGPMRDEWQPPVPAPAPISRAHSGFTQPVPERASLPQRTVAAPPERTVTPPPAEYRPAVVHEAQPTRTIERSEPPAPTMGGTIYLCKSYSGTMFWAQAHCGQHNALIESIVPVPAGMPFEQQVEVAQQHRREVAQATYQAPAQPTPAPAAVSNKAECENLDREIEQLDAAARQPQSAQMQDWLREKRKAARDRQFAIRC